MTASKARIITQLAKRKTSAANNQMSATSIYYPPAGRLSVPISSAKPKKKKKQSVPKAEAPTHGAMPSSSQYSTS